MHKCIRDCWTAAIYAGAWYALDWLSGSTTSLRTFAVEMALWGIALWCALFVRSCWQARRQRLYVQSLRDLHTADQDALKKRYFELTGMRWPE